MINLCEYSLVQILMSVPLVPTSVLRTAGILLDLTLVAVGLDTH